MRSRRVGSSRVSSRTTTIGRERSGNRLLTSAQGGIVDEHTFVTRLLGGLGSYPAYFARLPEANRRGSGRTGLAVPDGGPGDWSTVTGAALAARTGR